MPAQITIILYKKETRFVLLILSRRFRESNFIADNVLNIFWGGSGSNFRPSYAAASESHPSNHCIRGNEKAFDCVEIPSYAFSTFAPIY